MSSREATCAGCGLVCDDIAAVVGDGGVERLLRTCPLGDAWFAERTGPAPPVARVDGSGWSSGGRSTRPPRS
jgi:formylmethanofuran dehydrogenase subunit B